MNLALRKLIDIPASKQSWLSVCGRFSLDWNTLVLQIVDKFLAWLPQGIFEGEPIRFVLYRYID